MKKSVKKSVKSAKKVDKRPVNERFDENQTFVFVSGKKTIGKTILGHWRPDYYGDLYIFFTDNTYATVGGDHSEDRPYFSDSWGECEKITFKEIKEQNDVDDVE